MTIYDTDSPTMAIAQVAMGLTSPNEVDSNGEPANVVDGLFAIARALNRVADAIRRDDDDDGDFDTICVDCGVETLPTDDRAAEFYMVHDDVWAAAGVPVPGGCLCVGCLETRLGRQLTRADFTDAPINDVATSDSRYAWSYRTDRLRQRLESA